MKECPLVVRRMTRGQRVKDTAKCSCARKHSQCSRGEISLPFCLSQTTIQHLTGNQCHIYSISHEFLLIGKTTTYRHSFTLNSDQVADSNQCVRVCVQCQPARAQSWLALRQCSTQISILLISAAPDVSAGASGPDVLNVNPTAESFCVVKVAAHAAESATVKKNCTCLNFSKAGKNKTKQKNPPSHHSAAVCVCERAIDC